ncbi:MAG: dihydrolipoamide acetyltransferase family protein [Candidatus Sulfotelmatobacter sp.]
MAFSVVMPALEMAQETGKLLAWRKQEGDRVNKGEPLLEIETDKAVVEVEAPADGILAGISALNGADIPVGQTIAWIVAPGEKPPAASAVVPAARAKTESHVGSSAAKTPQPSAAATARVSPKARRLARELGVDISNLRGSGAGGEILASDVQTAAAAPVASYSAPIERQSAKVEIPSTVGRLMAERMIQSWTTVPHFFVSREIEATALNQYRAKLTAEIERTQSTRVTHTDLLVALAARVLLKHPRLNSSWSPEGILLHDHVNMAVAVAVNDGVVAAVIHNAHSARIADIAQQRSDLADRARTGKLHPADISDATFTISNLGMHHVDSFTAIITPPQAAILAVGSISDRVVAVDRMPAIRPMMTLTLSCDHRAVDGARAAMFLNDLANAITEPEKWLASIR